MKSPYPLNEYVITYDGVTKRFIVKDKDGVVVAEGLHGRELGRDAWDDGAEAVVYDYDLGLDEKIPMRPRHEKHKA